MVLEQSEERKKAKGRRSAGGYLFIQDNLINRKEACRGGGVVRVGRNGGVLVIDKAPQRFLPPRLSRIVCADFNEIRTVENEIAHSEMINGLGCCAGRVTVRS